VQPGCRFAALASGHVIRSVRAVVYPVEASALRLEQRLHPRLHRAEIGLGDQPPSDPGLVGDHDHRPPGISQPHDRFGGTRKQFHTLRVAGIVPIDDDRAVPIEKCGAGHPAVTWNPASTYMTSPVMPVERSEARKRVALPTSSTSIGRFIGARSAVILRRSRKWATPRAARVFTAPAEIALMRMPRCPRSTARYRTEASRAAFATPMTLYPGTAFSEP